MDTRKFLDDFLQGNGFIRHYPPAEDHQLVAAVTSFQDPFLTQVRLADLWTGDDRNLYVCDVATFPGFTPGQPNFCDYLLGTELASPGTRWVVDDMYANTHGIHVHPVYGSVDPGARPIGRQFERTQPVRVASEVRALVNTTEGIVYLHCNMPWKDEASEREAVSKLSALLGKRYWKEEEEFPAVSDLVQRRLQKEGVNITQAMMVTLRRSGQEPLRLEDTRDYVIGADVQERQISNLSKLNLTRSVTYGKRDERDREKILASLPVALEQALGRDIQKIHTEFSYTPNSNLVPSPVPFVAGRGVLYCVLNSL